MRLGTLALFALLAGCVTTSGVEPAGQDTFTVTAASHLCDGCTLPQTRAARQARAYCAELSKTMVESRLVVRRYGKSVTLIFRCVLAA